MSLAINPGLFPRMPYDTLKDLDPIGMIASSQHVLVVNPSLKASSIKELIALTKAQPGSLNYGSTGNGSTFHMSAELFKAVAGTEILHVPYREGGSALNDTIAGMVNMSFPVLSAAKGMVDSGRLRALGMTGPQRSSLMPNVPTIAEAGLPDYNIETWFMVLAPAGTPKAVLDKLNSSLNQALNAPALKERLVRDGFDPIPSTPAQAKDRLVKEMPVWSKLFKDKGMRISQSASPNHGTQRVRGAPCLPAPGVATSSASESTSHTHGVGATKASTADQCINQPMAIPAGTRRLAAPAGRRLSNGTSATMPVPWGCG